MKRVVAWNNEISTSSRAAQTAPLQGKVYREGKFLHGSVPRSLNSEVLAAAGTLRLETGMPA
jgi:hypothetical protein